VRSATNWRNGRAGIRVTIADTGCGLSSEAKKRIYKPFFTTKESTGTGLGLWVSAGIIEKHAGAIRFRSTSLEKWHGTVFAVFLPTKF
jgi:signal transduction histidine kinase